MANFYDHFRNLLFKSKFPSPNYFSTHFFHLIENANQSLRHFHFHFPSHPSTQERKFSNFFLHFVFFFFIISSFSSRLRKRKKKPFPYPYIFPHLYTPRVEANVRWDEKYYINNKPAKKNFHHNSSLGTHMCMTDEHSRVKMR